MKRLTLLFACLTLCASCASPWGDTEVADNTAEDWVDTVAGDYVFKMPAGWAVSFRHYVAPVPFDLLEVKNTDLSVVAGGAAPDDFYAGGGLIDTGKYADAYSLIQVAVYDREVGESWDEFFQKIYPGIITSYGVVPREQADGLDMVYAERVSGVYSGVSRIFARAGGKFYDLSLHCQSADTETAGQTFATFIANFRF